MAKIESLQPQVKINRLLQRQQRVIHQENLAILDRLQRCESHYNVNLLEVQPLFNKDQSNSD